MSSTEPSIETSESTKEIQAPRTLGAYVHLPWCVRKCPYCDFNSHESKGEIPEREYVTALLRDLETEIRDTTNRALSSVFFGGGTPSLFSADAIGSIIESLDQHIGLAPDCEITLEANPGTAEAARFRGYRTAGVNRLSIGVQSFDDALLKRIGRIHGGEEALRAIAMAVESGFDNFNIDLMYAQPGQSVEAALADIRSALVMNPTHLSCYQLTIEPNTLFHVQQPTLPNEDDAFLMQDLIAAELTAAGFENYEVSAWSKPDKRSEHNTNYWLFGDYLGIGAGAHGKLTVDGSARRRFKQKHPRRYMDTAGSPDCLGGDNIVGPDDIAFEFMLNALRLTDGFAVSRFEQTTGLNFSSVADVFEKAQSDGLVVMDPAHVRPTDLGRRFLNDLTARFL